MPEESPDDIENVGNLAEYEPITKALAIKDDPALCDEFFNLVRRAHSDEEPLEKYAVPERVVLLIWRAYAPISNGGFYYLFSANIEGDPGYELTAQAFEAIDCKSCATAFREAMALFPGGKPPLDLDERRAALRKFPENAFDELDSRFYSAGQFHSRELEQKLALYIRKHEATFRAMRSP